MGFNPRGIQKHLIIFFALGFLRSIEGVCHNSSLTLACSPEEFLKLGRTNESEYLSLKIFCPDKVDKVEFEILLNHTNIPSIEVNNCDLFQNVDLFNSSFSVVNLSVNNVSDSEFISGLISSDFQLKFPLLETLNLSRNDVTGTFDLKWLCHLKIKSLDLSFNSIDQLTVLSANGEDCEISDTLEFLDLSQNKLNEVENLLELKSLRKLKLSGNEIKNFSFGSQLKSLKVLDLANNEISSINPLAFDEMESLEELNMRNNLITSWPPLSDSFNKHLSKLDLSHNLISWVENGRKNCCSKLKVLKLSFNHLRRLEMLRDLKLPMLQQLFLDGNEIESWEENLFAPLPSLESIDLSKNRLKHFFLTNIFPRLAQLNLDHNNLIKFELNEDLLNLADLHLSGNSLEQVPEFGTQSNLKTLDLGENKIVRISNRSFEGLSNLFGLRLIENKIEEISPTFCSSLSKLRVLNIGQNKLSGHVSLSCLGLRALRLDKNEIKVLDLMKSSSLMWVNASHNLLDELRFSPSVEYADMSFNSLAQIPFYSRTLRVLDTSNNQLSSLNLSEFRRIEILKANGNEIKEIVTNSKIPFSLQRLELRSNLLKNVPVGLSRVELFLGGNELQCDCSQEWLRNSSNVMDPHNVSCESEYGPHPLSHTRNFLCVYKSHCFALCQCCDFDFCDCSQFCPENCTCLHNSAWDLNSVHCSFTFTEVPQKIPMDVTELYLDGNELKVLKNHIFIGKRNLVFLYLNGSRVEIIGNRSFNGLRHLKALHLNDNYLTQLHGHEFSELENLRELYLGNNLIHSIELRTFANLRNLEKLQLSNNLLVEYAVWDLSHIKNLYLAYNPWSCQKEFAEKFNKFAHNFAADSQYTIVVECEEESELEVVGRESATGFWAFILSTLSIVLSFVVLLVFRREVRGFLTRKFLCTTRGLLPLDSYLIYGPKDKEFVMKKFVPRLNEWKLRLAHGNLDEKNGVNEEALRESRKIVIFLTSDLRDHFPRLFQSHFPIRYFSKFIFVSVKTEDAKVSGIPFSQRDTILSWADPNFWRKLRQKLEVIRGDDDFSLRSVFADIQEDDRQSQGGDWTFRTCGHRQSNYCSSKFSSNSSIQDHIYSTVDSISASPLSQSEGTEVHVV